MTTELQRQRAKAFQITIISIAIDQPEQVRAWLARHEQSSYLLGEDALAMVETDHEEALRAEAIHDEVHRNPDSRVTDRCVTPGHVHVHPESIHVENGCTLIPRTVAPRNPDNDSPRSADDGPICTPERRLDHEHTIACGPMGHPAPAAYQCWNCSFRTASSERFTGHLEATGHAEDERRWVDGVCQTPGCGVSGGMPHDCETAGRIS